MRPDGYVFAYASGSLRVFQPTGEIARSDRLQGDYGKGQMGNAVAAAARSRGQGGLSLRNFADWMSGKRTVAPGSLIRPTSGYWQGDTIVLGDHFLIHRFSISGRSLGVTAPVLAQSRESAIAGVSEYNGRILVVLTPEYLNPENPLLEREMRAVEPLSGKVSTALLKISVAGAGFDPRKPPDAAGRPGWYALTKANVYVARDSGSQISVFDRWGRLVRDIVVRQPNGARPLLIRSLLAAEDGTLALVRTPEAQPAAADSAMVDMIGPTGTYLGSVTIPPDFELEQFTGRELVGVQRSPAGSEPASRPRASERLMLFRVE